MLDSVKDAFEMLRREPGPNPDDEEHRQVKQAKNGGNKGFSRHTKCMKITNLPPIYHRIFKIT